MSRASREDICTIEQWRAVPKWILSRAFPFARLMLVFGLLKHTIRTWQMWSSIVTLIGDQWLAHLKESPRFTQPRQPVDQTKKKTPNTCEPHSIQDLSLVHTQWSALQIMKLALMRAIFSWQSLHWWLDWVESCQTPIKLSALFR